MAFKVEQLNGVYITDEDGRSVAVSTPSTCPALCVSTTQHLLTFTKDYAGAQTNTAIITPPAGKHLCIHHCYTSTDQAAVNTVLSFATSGITVFKIYVSKEQSAGAAEMHVDGATDEPLSLTCGADTFVSVSYTIQD